MSGLSLKGISKSYGSVEVIENLNLDVNSGEFLVLVGPSGCGKSTLLRMIAGLEEISDGTISIGDRIVNDLPASQRNLSMVFQSYALYPHMDVRKNLAFGLTNLKMPKSEINRRVQEASDILQIGELLNRKPRQLSGGQKQRVAIGRAIVREPELFLFDEPLSNLDAELRVQMRVELASLYNRLGTTMIYVTHDQVEAMTMATRIVVLRAGKIEQIGTPYELYNQPQNLFVAGFIGSPKINTLPATASSNEGGLQINITNIGKFSYVDLATTTPNISVCIRPESFKINQTAELNLDVEIILVEYLGSEIFLHVKIATGQTLMVQASGKSNYKLGEKISISANPQDCHYFDADGQRIQAKNA